MAALIKYGMKVLVFLLRSHEEAASSIKVIIIIIVIIYLLKYDNIEHSK